jgi:hypothetical protein
VTNSTFAGNFASGGGAMTLSSGLTTVTNVTLSGNSASSSAGGIYSNFSSGSGTRLRLRNSILRAGASGANIAFSFQGSGIVSLGHNISSDNGAGVLVANGDRINTDPQLDPTGLRNNGGFTKTIALLAGSPAVDTADSANAPVTDQRLYFRNGAADVGSFEFAGIVPPAPLVLSAVSRKVHGASGTFDIDLPTEGGAGIECRSGGATRSHQVVVTFATPVSVADVHVSSTDGRARAAYTASATQVIVNLAGVTNGQTIGITLRDVSDGSVTGNVGIPMGILVGDLSGNGTVNASDIGATKAQSGQPVSTTNFRSDALANGTINATDIALGKSASGTVLSP